VIGKTLGHYQVIEKVGEGGMGVVYKARDLHLSRLVALKVLPQEKVSDPERKRRFVKEARAASALNHPNIITVYDIDKEGAIDYMAMEYVSGQTLSQLIAGKGLQISNALKYAVQIADALAKAHAAGIVHRDLKPGNIMVTDDGLVKVLDFGLAKLTQSKEQDPLGATVTAEPTTQQGVIVGTMNYMSPEQCQGKEIDARSDIFSFGVVLYEMVTGRQAFRGETGASTMAAILERDPTPPGEIVRDLPPELERLITQCLRKDTDRRIQHMVDVKLSLLDLKEDSDSGRRPPSGGQVQRRRKMAVPLAIAALLLITISVLLRPSLPPPRVVNTRKLTNDGWVGKGGLVCDGSTLYFHEDRNDRSVLGQVSAAGGETVVIPVSFPETHPQLLLADLRTDRHELLLISRSTAVLPGGSPLWVLPVPGGALRRLGSLLVDGARWSPDREWLACATDRQIFLARSDGSDTRQIFTLAKDAEDIALSPDGKRIRFTMSDPQDGLPAIWEVSTDGSGLHRILPAWRGGAHRAGRWTQDGRYFVFVAGRPGATEDIWAAREAPGYLRKANGEPVRLTFGPVSYSHVAPGTDGKRLFAVGVLARGELTRGDLSTGHLVPYRPGLSADSVDFSKDGAWLTYVRLPEFDLWRSRSDGSQSLQLVAPPMHAYLPRWSPDGRQIAFAGQLPGKPWRIYLISADGGMPVPLISGEGTEFDANWSPDGLRIVFAPLPWETTPDRTEVSILDLKTRQVSSLAGSKGLYSPRWSPDGSSIVAVTSDTQELMLLDFKNQTWGKLPTGPTHYPMWSRSGKYVYYGRAGTGSPDLYGVRIADRKVEKLLDLKGVRIAYLPGMGPWVGLTPQDEPLILRDVGSEEIYSLDWEAP